MKKLFLLLVAVLSIGLYASAQTRTVKGTVVDAHNGEPLIGASVTAGANNTLGVTTDVDGDFTIVVPASTTHLTVSYVGYASQQVTIGNQKLVVRLEPQANALDEVIAVAYGTAKRSEYTGAAGVVKADQLEDALVTNAVSALNGKVSGVQTMSSDGQPGSAPTVRVRGTGSINASSNPLYVVDGVPFIGSTAEIAPSDIAEMTILKDAASTALYGARGANGVILITTKRGQEGNARVTAEARWGSNSRAIPSYDVIKDQRLYMETMYTGYNYTRLNKYGETAAAANNWINNNIWGAGLGYQTWTIPDGQKTFDMNGKFNPNATPGYTKGGYYFIADDWAKEGLVHGLRQEYNVSVAGGSERLQFYISGSYLSDDGIVKGTNYDRFSTRATVDYQAKPWLKLGTSLSYAYTKTNSSRDTNLGQETSSGNVFYFIDGLAPMYPMYIRSAETKNIMWNEAYGCPIYDYGDGRTDYGYGVPAGSRTPSGNPIGSMFFDKDETLDDVLDSKWYAIITPIKGLSFTQNVGYYLSNTRGHTVLNPVYGQFADIGGEAVQSQVRTYDITLQSILSYNHIFGEIHEMDLMAAYESEEMGVESLSGRGDNLYSAFNPYLDNTIDNKDAGGSRRELAHRGFLFRGKYTLDSRYFLMASLRRDGSSRFAPGHRWGTFWSVSAGWDIAKEKFMEPFTNVDLLKFRASFGQNGNDGIGNSTLYMPWADFFVMSGANGVFSDGELAQKGNVDLTWETSNAFNVGFDFSFFKGMLSGSLEYYNRQTSDMLFNLPVAPSMGFGSIPSNIGSMRNNGFELDLNYRVLNLKDVTVNLYGNITFGWNKVLKLPADILNSKGEWVRGTYQHLREGKSMYTLYLPQYAGVVHTQEEANKLNDISLSNGGYIPGQALYFAKYTKDDVAAAEAAGIEGVVEGAEYLTNQWETARSSNSKYIDNVMPLAYGGFGINAQAYGFDLNVGFSYQFGGKMIDYGYQNTLSTGGAMHKDLLDAWTPQNPNSNMPALYAEADIPYANNMSDRFLISSNYLQLTNISLGYTIPSRLTRKIGIESVRVYGTAENVALWTKRKGLDPRQVLSAGSNFGASNYTYSPIRAISGGIRVSF